MAEVPSAVALVDERLVRTEREGSPKEVFDDALLLLESSLKWLVVSGITLIRTESPDHAVSLGARVARGDSAGAWVTALRDVASRCSRLHAGEIRQFANQINRKQRADEVGSEFGTAVSELAAIIDLLGEVDYNGTRRQRHSLVDLFADFVFVRNRTRGHGAHQSDFFRDVAPRAAAAARAVAALLPQEPVWWIVDDSGRSRLLIGATPNDLESPLVPAVLRAPGAWVLAGAVVGRLEPLALVDSAGRTLFANGRWNDSRAICQFIDYASGASRFENLPQYAGRDTELPRSETAPRDELVWEQTCAHNLPDSTPHYVARPSLEGNVRRLLSDRVHRIITLRGGGGMGKTALALAVLWEMVRSGEPGFDFVIWFSARDVDLLSQGPVDRQRDIGDLDSLATRFAHAMEHGDLTGEPAVNFMKQELSAPDSMRYLLVIDNLETFDAPDRLQQFLDEFVVLPSKVLLTSRHEEFRGDYPVVVEGMERPEAEALIGGEARRHYAEGVVLHARDRIISATGSRPYAMKLAVAQIAAGDSPDNVLRELPTRQDVLAALFDRSFSQVAPDGRFLYLLMGRLGTRGVEFALRAIFAIYGKDFDAAAQDLVRLSLATRDAPDALQRSIRLPEMAYQHARRRLVGDPDEIEVEGLAGQLRSWLSPRTGRSPIESFFQNVMETLDERDRDQTDRLLGIMEATANDAPELWLPLAQQIDGRSIAPERVRAAYKRAAEEAAPDDGDVWAAWAAFEDRQGDRLQYLYKSIRSVEADPSDVRYCSQVAFDLAGFLTGNKDVIPPMRRSFMVTSVRDALDGHGTKLAATDLSRLGWLYFIEYQPTNPNLELVRSARRSAEAGLAIEPDNVHCQRLFDRTDAELDRQT